MGNPSRKMTIMNESILSIIGNTPLVRLNRVFDNLHFNLYAKLESLNPGGSMKDRPALNIIRHGLATGEIEPGAVVIESSSGNMGIGLAQACSYYDLRFICVVDPKTTEQNIRLLRAYGAEVDIVTRPDPETGEFLKARIDRVKELLETVENSFWPNQYSNEFNPLAHYMTMEEIVNALDGRVDYVFCATSTCGTLRGCAEYVKNTGLGTKVYAVDALGSVIFGGQKSKRLIPGHGAAMRPALFNDNLADRSIHVTDRECVIGCRRLARREAIMAGGSSGAILMAVERVKDEIPRGANCAMILPDRGERYLETIYSDSWVTANFGYIENNWEIPMEAETCVMATY
ncbi:MAG: 2,3-diaminopropionate biosynthesis protein SbnA [Pyrinomonadaceae bacterium]